MTKEYGTIKIPQDAYNKHNERRQALGLTWEEYIDGEAPDTVDVDDLKAVTATPEDLTALRSDLLESLERIESGVSTVEERTGALDRRLSEMGGRQ